MAEQPQNRRPRPLSPHLQIYRWPITMATSITHRATGIALAAGALTVAWWLVAAALGDDTYATFSMAARSPLGLLVLFGFTWSLAYHSLNGIRHLVWDAGYGFELRTADRSGILVIVLSVIVAIGAFAYAYADKGLS